MFGAAIVVIVFDHRFGWSPAVPAYLSILGDALGALGILVYLFVVKENRYAAATVTVVKGQTVVSTGPYAIVRHPMYAGALLVCVGAPLALGSWWGLLITPFFIGWFAWRLLHEENYLRENLPGYTEYAHKVRRRLVPYIGSVRAAQKSYVDGPSPAKDVEFGSAKWSGAVICPALWCGASDRWP